MKTIQPLFIMVEGSDLDIYAVELVTALVERLRESDKGEADKIPANDLFHSIDKVLNRSKVILKRDLREDIEVIVISKQFKSYSLKKRIQAINILETDYNIPQTCIIKD